MSLENDFILSFYEQIAEISTRHHVYLVQHRDTGEFFVKKTVSPESAFIYGILKGKDFPNIPKVIECVIESDCCIIIEEYIHGKTLEKLMETKSFSEAEVCRIIKNLCQILLPLHQNQPNIIHRDIKPSNLILDQHGHLHLIDFDASKSYAPGKNRDTVLMGTAEYAAPEQYGFRQSDQRTDIYSMGVLMNKMLTGRFPSEEKASGRLAPVIEKCISIDPENRYSDCAELLSALNNLREKEKNTSPSTDHTKDNSALSVKPKKKKKWQIAAILITLLLTILCGMNAEFTNGQNIPYTGFDLWLNRICATAALCAEILYFTNCFNLRNLFPWKKSAGIKNMLRLITGFFLLFLIPAAVCVLFEQ